MRAHEFITEDARTMILWHGGNLTARPDNLELIAQKKGRFEFGSGLYATTNWDTAQKYAKGSRKLYKITLQQGNDANITRISTDAVLQFVNQFVPKAKRADVTERIQRRSKNGEILADTFSNIILNSEAIRPANTKDMSEFLVSQGVDYLSVPNAFGWGEMMMVIYNMRKVTNIQQVTSKDKIDQYDLPTEFTEEEDYRGQHGAPDQSDAPLSDLTANGIYPEDVYSSQGPQYYGSYSPGDNAVFGMIHAYRNKPNKPVRIYRAVPAPQNTAKMLSTLEKQMASFMKRGRAPADSEFRDPNDWYTWASRERERLANLPQEKAEKLTINPGDWVSIDREYAVDHGESALNGDYKILSKVVPAGQVFTNGDSIREWGWSP